MLQSGLTGAARSAAAATMIKTSIYTMNCPSRRTPTALPVTSDTIVKKYKIADGPAWSDEVDCLARSDYAANGGAVRSISFDVNGAMYSRLGNRKDGKGVSAEAYQ